MHDCCTARPLTIRLEVRANLRLRDTPMALQSQANGSSRAMCRGTAQAQPRAPGCGWGRSAANPRPIHLPRWYTLRPCLMRPLKTHGEVILQHHFSPFLRAEGRHAPFASQALQGPSPSAPFPEYLMRYISLVTLFIPQQRHGQLWDQILGCKHAKDKVTAVRQSSRTHGPEGQRVACGHMSFEFVTTAFTAEPEITQHKHTLPKVTLFGKH